MLLSVKIPPRPADDKDLIAYKKYIAGYRMNQRQAKIARKAHV